VRSEVIGGRMTPQIPADALHVQKRNRQVALAGVNM